LSLAALVLIGMASTAKADVIIDQIAEINGPTNNGGFPIDLGVLGTFAYVIPAGQQIVSANITGTWGNSQISSTAEGRIFVDGTLVATAGQVEFNQQAPSVWSYNFSAAELPSLADGFADLSVIQDTGFVIRIGDTIPVQGLGPTLTIITQQVGAAPEPGTFVLFAAGGLLGATVLRRRRR
jgi:hypothetical protein